jgi:hypothetical protein
MSLNRVVPLSRVCALAGVARSSVYFARRAEVRELAGRTRTRCCGERWLGDDELVVHIRRVLGESPFLGEGYRKVWAKLRFGGVRISPGRVRRLGQVPFLLEIRERDALVTAGAVRSA